MAKKEEKVHELFIDWRHLLTTLLKKLWLIVICGVVLGVGAFVYTSFFVAPKYSSSVMLYVNNKSFSLNEIDVSISAADLSASQSLIDTYIVIMNNRTTMEEVAERADVDYHYSKLMSMISTSKVEGTEVFKVTVTSEDPYEAAHIANCISEVLPGRIEDIIDGSSMRIVDSAVVNTGKVSPNIFSDTFRAFVVGCLVMAIIIAVLAILDDTIRSEDYLTQNYDLPILAIIPDFDTKSGSRSSYYRNYYTYHSYGAENTAEAEGEE